jgi:hypothetical protein
MKRHHGFTHTTVHHHKDGSHTVHHHHEKGPEHDVEHAVADHDGMMDSMHEHLSPEMAGGEGGAEEAMEAGASGGGGAV